MLHLGTFVLQLEQRVSEQQRELEAAQREMLQNEAQEQPGTLPPHPTASTPNQTAGVDWQRRAVRERIRFLPPTGHL